MDYEDQSQFLKYINLQGFVRVSHKKQSSTNILRNSSSIQYYLMYLNEGRVMSLWNAEPTNWDQKPCWLAFTREVTGVLLSPDNTSWTVEVNLSEDSDEVQEFLTENIENNINWVDSINFFSNYWNSKPPEPYEESGSHEHSTIRPEVMLEIMVEIEKKFETEYYKFFNYEKLLVFKQLKNDLQLIDKNILEKRVVFSYIKKYSTKLLDSIITEIINDDENTAKYTNSDQSITNSNKNSALENNIIYTPMKFAILVNSKNPDILSDDVDEHIQQNDDLPIFMKCETMYVFLYQFEGDNSTYNFKIDTYDIERIEACDPGNLHEGYSFLIELRDKGFIFNCMSAIECKKWIDLLKKSKNNSQEISRTKFNTQRRDVEFLVYNTSYKGVTIEEQVKIDINQFFESLNLETDNLNDILESYTEALDFLDYTLDALQAHRPFYSDLFRSYQKNYHLELIVIISGFWNERYKSLSAKEVLNFTNKVSYHEFIINQYNMNEPRFNESYSEFAELYCQKVFHSLVPEIIPLLDEARTEEFKQKFPIFTNIPKKLYTVLHILLESLRQENSELVQSKVMVLCFKLVFKFQVEMIQVLNENLKTEIFCAWTNSCILAIHETLDFLNVVQTISKFPIESIKVMFSYQLIVKTFENLSNLAFSRLQSLIKSNFHIYFVSVNYKQFSVPKFLNQKDYFKITKITAMLNRSQSQKIEDFIFEQVSLYYLQMVMANSLHYTVNKEDVDSLVIKITKEAGLLENYFKKKVSEKDFLVQVQKLNAIATVWVCENTEVISHICVLRLALKKSFHENCVKIILRLRNDITKHGYNLIFDCLKEKYGELKQRDRISLGRFVMKTVDIEVICFNFIQKLRTKIQERKKLQKRMLKKQKENSFMHNDINRSINFEDEASINLNGNVEFGIMRLSKYYIDIKDFFKRKKDNIKFKRYYFVFYENLLIWKDDHKQKIISGTVYLNNIVDLSIYVDKKNPDKKYRVYIFWKIGFNLYSLQFTNENECKIWARAINFLKNEYEQEFEPVQFEKFEAVSEDKKYEDLFHNDVKEYDYSQFKTTNNTELNRISQFTNNTNQEDNLENQVKADSLRFVEVNKLSKLIIEKNRYDFSKMKINYDVNDQPEQFYHSNENNDYYKKLSIRSDDELSYSDDETKMKETKQIDDKSKANNVKNPKETDFAESFNNFKKKMKTKNKEFIEKPETQKFIKGFKQLFGVK